jgi:hypothetical protein
LIEGLAKKISALGNAYGIFSNTKKTSPKFWLEQKVLTRVWPRSFQTLEKHTESVGKTKTLLTSFWLDALFQLKYDLALLYRWPAITSNKNRRVCRASSYTFASKCDQGRTYDISAMLFSVHFLTNENGTQTNILDVSLD